MLIHIYVENSRQVMSKEFSNDKGITSEHDDRETSLSDKGITKSDGNSMSSSQINARGIGDEDL